MQTWQEQKESVEILTIYQDAHMVGTVRPSLIYSDPRIYKDVYIVITRLMHPDYERIGCTRGDNIHRTNSLPQCSGVINFSAA